MKNFDVFIGIDWSGAKAPIRTKSIAVATIKKEQDQVALLDIRSRMEVFEFIKGLSHLEERAFIGIDCNFGYAASIVEKQFGTKAKYLDLWDVVERTSASHSNFFAGGFWESAKYKDYFWTEGKKPDGFEMPKRHTEIACADQNYGNPESPFKLIGAKQVGKGGLAGMRMAYALKESLGSKVCIWPFENHYDKAQIVISEIYPRQFIKRVGLGNKKLNGETLQEALQYYDVNGFKGEVTDHDADALITAAALKKLCGNQDYIPDTFLIPTTKNSSIKEKEGWIFGVA